MKVTINGAEKDIADNHNLSEIISQFCKSSQHVIAEVNGEIVRIPRWG